MGGIVAEPVSDPVGGAKIKTARCSLVESRRALCSGAVRSFWKCSVVGDSEWSAIFAIAGLLPQALGVV